VISKAIFLIAHAALSFIFPAIFFNQQQILDRRYKQIWLSSVLQHRE